MKLFRRNKPDVTEENDRAVLACQQEIKAHTPEGWAADIDVIGRFCHASNSLDGLLTTIPVMTRDWSHARLINGFFGFDMIGGHPFGVRTRESGASIYMHYSEGRTTVDVWSHPVHYKEAIDLAQLIVSQAHNGYLRLVKKELAGIQM